MTYLKEFPARAKEAVSQAKKTRFAYSYIEGAYVGKINDTNHELVGQEEPKEYVAKIPGPLLAWAHSSGTSIIGAQYYEYPDKSVLNSDLLVFGCADGKIYGYRDDTVFIMRDVTADSYTINSFSAYAVGKYLYAVINDASMGYTVPTGKTITNAKENSPSGSPGLVTKITSPSHGFSNADTVVISGTNDYDGEFVVSGVGTNYFTIQRAYTKVVTSGSISLKTSYASKIYRYAGVVDTTVSAVADYSGTVAGTVKVTTSAAHAYVTGQSVVIAGTTDYNGTFALTVVDTTNFYITETYTSSQTGTAKCYSMTLEDAQGLHQSKLLAGMENRLLSIPKDGTAQYSKLNVSGIFNDFTSGSALIDGGQVGGQHIRVNAALYLRGLTFLIEEDRVGVHKIQDALSIGGIEFKNNNTYIPSYSVDGYGTKSKHGAIAVKGNIYFGDPKNGIIEYAFSSSTTGDITFKKTNLAKDIQETLLGYDLTTIALGYDRKLDLLMVSCSTTVGIPNNVIFYYSFETETWSKDPTKYIKQFVYHKKEEKMYGISSITGKILEVFGGGYTDEFDDPIKLKVRFRHLYTDDPEKLKEYIESSFVVGTTGEFKVSFLLENSDSPYITTTVAAGTLSDTGVIFQHTWGPGLWAGGSDYDGISLTYKQYYNIDVIPDHKYMVMEIEEISNSNFVIYNPVIKEEITSIIADDFV